MASVSFTEQEYLTLSMVVIDLHARGEIEDALVLDKLAKKANTALTKQRYGYMGGGAKEGEVRDAFQALSPLESLRKLESSPGRVEQANQSEKG